MNGKKSQPHVASSSPKKNLVLAVVAAGCLLGAAVVIYLQFGKKPGGPPVQPAQRSVRPQMPGGDEPYSPRSARRPTGPRRLQLPPGPSDAESLELAGTIEQFWRRYDQAVKNYDAAGWYQLGRWARERGLLVEANRAFRHALLVDATYEPAQQALSQEAGRFPGRVLIKAGSEPKDWLWLDRDQFRKEYVVPPRADWSLSVDQLRRQLRDLADSENIASLSRIAEIIVKIDLPEGREAYRKLIAKDNFRQLLRRSLAQRGVGGLDDSQFWLADWFQGGPVNIWLLRELIALKEEKAEAKKEERPRRPSRPPGPPGMGGPGPGPRMYRGGPRQVVLDTETVQNKMLLLKTLAARGGLVASSLIGELFTQDHTNGKVFENLIYQGDFDGTFLTRFTDRLALPMVEPLGELLQAKTITQQQWFQVAQLLSQRFTRQGAYRILSSAASRQFKLPESVAFNIALSCDDHALGALAAAVAAKQVEPFDLRTVFALWTTQSERAGMRGLWRTLDAFNPATWGMNLPGQTPRGAAGGPTGPGELQFELPGEMPMPPDMEAGLGPPGPGDARARASRKGRFFAKRPRPKAPSDEGQETKPAKRAFKAGINAAAARRFLVRLCSQTGEQPAPAQDRQRGGRRPRPPGRPQRRPQQATTPTLADHAAACLVSLYEPQLRGFYESLLGDPKMGSWAVLGLALLGDASDASRQAMIARFDNKPFEWPRPLATKKEQLYPQPEIGPGVVSVPLDQFGLATCGISAREGLMILDVEQAAARFMEGLGRLFAGKPPDEPAEAVAAAADQIIQGIAQWRPPGGARLLTDLVESAGDFGLRGKFRPARRGRRHSTGTSSPLATRLRSRALQVLGQIGQRQAMDVMVRLATMGDPASELSLAAKVALAKARRPEVVDILLDAIDPARDSATRSVPRSLDNQISQALQSIDPGLKSIEDVTLLAVRRCPLSDSQIERVLGILESLGAEQAPGRGRRRGLTGDLQQRLMLALVSSGQGKVLRSLASLIAHEPRSLPSSGRRSGGDEASFYWNVRDHKTVNQAFLEMVRALADAVKIQDEQAAFEFLEAILNRQARWIVPQEEKLESWNPDQHLIRLAGFARRRMPRPRRYDTPARPGALLPEEMGMAPPQYGPPPVAARGNLSPRSVAGKVGRTRQMPLAGMDQTGPPMPEMPTRPPRRASRRLIKRAAGGEAVIDIPRAARASAEPISASEAAIDLISKLSAGRQFLAALTRHEVFGHLAWLNLRQAGAGGADAGLVRALLNREQSMAGLFLNFCALEHLEDRAAVTVLPALGELASKSTVPQLQQRACDAALVLLQEASASHTGGLQRILADESLRRDSFAPWMDLTTHAARLPADMTDKIFIILAFGSIDDGCTRAMTDMLRSVLNKGPISVEAVSMAVDVVGRFGPVSSDAVLDLYNTILSAQGLPNSTRQGLAGENRQGAQPLRREPDRSRRPAGRGDRGRRYGGTRRDRRRGGRAVGPARRATPTVMYLYTDVAPKVIQAIAAMPGDKPTLLLQQLYGRRMELSGHLAVAMFARNPRLGEAMVLRAFNNQRLEQQYPDQIILLIEFLSRRPSAGSLANLAMVVAKAMDSRVRASAVDAMENIIETAETTGQTINAVNPLLSSLNSCLSRARYDEDLAVQLIGLLEKFDDPQVTATLKRLSKSAERKVAQAAERALE